MSYIADNLKPNETILFETRKHWIISILFPMTLLFLIIPASAVQDYNSTSTGTIEWEPDVVYVGNAVNFHASVVREINPNFDVQKYYFSDDNGYVADLHYVGDVDENTKVYAFDYERNEDTISFFATEPGTRTLYLYEYYEYWNETVGATEWHTKLLDSDTITIVKSPSSAENNIWTKLCRLFNF